MPYKNQYQEPAFEPQNPTVIQEDVTPGDAGIALHLTPEVAMYIDTGNCQNQGARPYQEDSFGYTHILDSDVLSNKGMFAILSDGMGGLSNGKSVADYTVQACKSMFEAVNPKLDISGQLKLIATKINETICSQYGGDNGRSTAGATLVLAYIFKNRMYWITAGDSRLYCFRNGHLLQMNEDHDYKNQLFRTYLQEGGNLAAIEQDRQKDSLVSFIGRKGLPHVDVSLTGYKIRPGDMFVLCSDGIYNGIPEIEMKEILSQKSAHEASETIVSRVLSRRLPGQDNMTIMVIRCDKKH